ncbi:MAG: methionine aminotransferase, partial [Flavobacteriales bacterium]
MPNYPFPISSKLPRTGETIFSVMSALANEHKAINLSQGFPGFEPDSSLIKKVNKAMQQGFNQYAPMAGSLNLRQQVSNCFSRRDGIIYDPE